MMNFLTALFHAIGEVFSFGKQRDAEVNSPEMQANAAAAKQQASVDEATHLVSDALARPDDPASLEALRKKVAK